MYLSGIHCSIVLRIHVSIRFFVGVWTLSSSVSPCLCTQFHRSVFTKVMSEHHQAVVEPPGS